MYLNDSYLIGRYIRKFFGRIFADPFCIHIIIFFTQISSLAKLLVLDTNVKIYNFRQRMANFF